MYKSNSEYDNRMWRKHGFYIHLEKDKEDINKVNYHTHGVLHNRGKSDFLITQPIDPIIAKMVFMELVDLLDQGFIIDEETVMINFMGDSNLEFSKTEDNDTVLRVIINEGIE